ncbi:MAG: hypothetical protein GXY01_03700 [Clostridiales bacterium]|jgi:Ni2+-binding GTPase involved in maturation of urease and hydrogenase|nr:hypothetical protein [Clostridiales bacterium]
MKIITVSGPPSSGKTAIILQIVKYFRDKNMKVGVAKFDCLTTEDDKVYDNAGIPVLTGISGNVCPDHYYVASIIPCAQWGEKLKLDVLILESAGLCNRCSPHMERIAAV